MSLSIHQIVTGQLENTVAGHLLNEGNHPRIPRESVLPHGFTDDHVMHNGTPMPGGMVPVPVWLIKGGSKNVLIDTGLGDLEEIMALMRTYGIDMYAARDEGQDIVRGLNAQGLEPDDIDIVVLTHAHFDHVGNNQLFRNAEFYIQRDEMMLAFAPPRYTQFAYGEYSKYCVDVRDRIRPLDGDAQIVPGLSVAKLGGHTPGTMVVYVETLAGKVCLAGDMAYNYRNLELNWPTGAYWDLAALMRGYDRMHLEADIIVPGHDWEFLQRYPDGTIGA